MKVALLFPGQGAQTAGFLHRLPPHDAIRSTLGEAAQLLGQDPLALDEPQALESTVNVQLGLLIAGTAAVRMLRAEQIEADAAAGLSIGAFAAAVACGSVSFADALRLVRVRATSMAQTHPTGYGLLAISGMEERAVGELIRTLHGFEKRVFLANVNGPTETVVAGDDRALQAISEAVTRTGARARRLCVATPSHSPLMKPTTARLWEEVRKVQFSAPKVPYIGNVRARALYTGAEVADDLALNVSNTVRWHDSINLLYELGCRVFVEPWPGRVLSRLVKESFPEAHTITLDGMDPSADLRRRILTAIRRVKS